MTGGGWRLRFCCGFTLQCVVLLTLCCSAIAQDAITTSPVTGEAADGDSALTGILEVDMFSAYYFRGTKFYSQLSIQPWIDLDYALSDSWSVGGFLWTHLPSGDRQSREDRWMEFDWNLRSAYTWESLTLSVGLNGYQFPNSSDQIPNTKEYYASLSLALPVVTTFSFIRDFDLYDEGFYQLDFTKDFEFEDFTLSPYWQFGWIDETEGQFAGRGFVHTTLGVYVTVPVGNYLLIPQIHQIFGSDEVALTEFWGGVSLAYEF